MIGRIIHLTEDGYIAINIPAKAKNVQLLFQGEKPYLKYKIGKEAKTHSLSFANLPVLEGSRVVGTFDGKSYEPEALAELMDIELAEVKDETHNQLLKLVQKGNIYFSNPKPKPRANADKQSPAYTEWKAAQDSLWQQACVLYLADPVREAQEKRAQQEAEKEPEPEAPATIEPVADTENAPAPEAGEKTEETIEPVALKEEQTEVLLANELFETGYKETIGLGAALQALRKKELTHEGFKKNAYALFKHAYHIGKTAHQEDMQPISDFLTALLERTTTGKENMKNMLGLDADAEKIFDEDIEKINGLLQLLTPAIHE